MNKDVKLIIRDDDMNFFTKVEDIESVYSKIENFPISFAVIPCVTDVSTTGNCPDTKGNETPQWVGGNVELITWLRERIKLGKADVLMHGITHQYKFIEGKRLAEMQWRDEAELADEICKYKKDLEQILNYDISVFVAPSNKISKYGIKCVSSNGLNFSGIVPIDFQREITFRNVVNYLKRCFLRAKDKLPYPNIMQYSSHKELNACTLQKYDYLVRMFNYCKKIGSPMAVNVHYWHLRDFPKEQIILTDFVKYAIDNGAVPSIMSELMKD